MFKKLFTILFLVGSLTFATAQEAQEVQQIPHPQLTKTYGCSPIGEIQKMLGEDHLKSMFFAESYSGFNMIYGDVETGAWVQLLIPRDNRRVICILDTGEKSFRYIPANEYRS